MRIDLLVTIVGLPGGMNGRQVADAGRAVRPRLKGLFVTGNAENADGYEMLIDGEGQRLSERRVGVVAGEVAATIRDRLGSGADLTDWTITVQDEFGDRVEVYGFDELRAGAGALAAA